MRSFKIHTEYKADMIDITRNVQINVENSKVKEGICVVFVPHTTAAVTINENADIDVKKDIQNELGKIVPDHDNYLHKENNSAAHIKSSVIGPSLSLIIANGKLVLGTWQGIYLCEFDGPRHREVHLQIVGK